MTPTPTTPKRNCPLAPAFPECTMIESIPPQPYPSTTAGELATPRPERRGHVLTQRVTAGLRVKALALRISHCYYLMKSSGGSETHAVFACDFGCGLGPDQRLV